MTVSAREIRVVRSIETGLRLHGDPDMIHTVINNLVSNALKFTPHGGTVGMAAARRSEQVVIEVADRGVGIDPGDRERVFEPFYRGEGTNDPRVPGTGLGLAICRDLVRAHGGEIVIVERKGWSTVFRVSLPESGYSQALGT